MELFLLIALGLLGSAAAFDLFSGNDDDDNDDDNQNNQNDTRGIVLDGNNLSPEVLTGTDLDDTISGGEGENDTLEGGAGDDLFQLRNSNTATGGPGMDDFVVDEVATFLTDGSSESFATITDFNPDEDILTVQILGDEDNPGAPPADTAYVWRAFDDIVTLNAIPAFERSEPGAGDFFGDPLLAVRGLSDIPPPEATEFEIVDIDGNVLNTLAADQMPFIEVIRGDPASTTSFLNEEGVRFSVEMGRGDDVVLVENANVVEANLGRGDDLYGRTGSLDNPPPVREDVFGGPGDDTLLAVARVSELVGGTGDDLLDLSGFAGADGSGNALAFGEEGNDTLQGSIVADFMDAGPGDDEVRADTSDRVLLEEGNDTLIVTPAPDPVGNGLVLDFDPAEDALIIELPADEVAGAVVTTDVFEPPNSFVRTDVLVNGEVALRMIGNSAIRPNWASCSAPSEPGPGRIRALHEPALSPVQPGSARLHKHPRGVQFARAEPAHGHRAPLERGPALVTVFHPVGEDHAGIAVAQPRRALGAGAHLGQIRQPLFQRPQMRVQPGAVRKLLDPVQAQPVGGVERARPQPPQAHHMAMAAQQLAQVARDRSHVAALAAGHLQLDMVRVGPAGQHQFLDPERAGRGLERLALAGQLVGPLTVDLHRRETRRHLHDVPHEPAQRGLDLRIGRPRLAGGDHLALRIVGIGGLAQPDGEGIGLQCIGDIGHGLGRLAQRHRQHAGGLRVQRAGMARLARFQRPAHLVDHRGGGHPRGLVHDQPAGNVAPLALSSHERPPSRPRRGA